MKKALLSLAVVLLGSTFAPSTMAAFFPDNIEKMCLAVSINDQKAITQCNQAKIGFMKQFVAERYAEALAATKNKKKLEASQKQFEKSLAAMLKGRPYRTADDAVQDGLS
ncbi:MAG: hypothetical protein LUC43_03460, partial [Burkholderiales bacterium]|nr:hypothetical protein [Burkholderiales bacterium]